MKDLLKAFGNEMSISTKGRSLIRKSGGKTITVFAQPGGYGIMIYGLTGGTRQIHVKSAEQSAMVAHALIKGCRLGCEKELVEFIDRFKTISEVAN